MWYSEMSHLRTQDKSQVPKESAMNGRLHPDDVIWCARSVVEEVRGMIDIYIFLNKR